MAVSTSSIMEVLVHDLCDPQVVAAIAKHRFFEIKDKWNLTPDIWKKFRDDIHLSQAIDPKDLQAKTLDCFPGLSEVSITEEWPEGYETPTESPEEKMERHKLEAKQAFDTLVKLGGRPTRPIRWIPPWKITLIDERPFYQDAEHEKEIFYDGVKYGCCLGQTEVGFVEDHWRRERNRFREELRQWQEFRDNQQWFREHRLNKAKEDDLVRQQDLPLTKSLRKLQDWKEYQAYFQRGIDRYKKLMEEARRLVEAIEQKDPGMDANIQKGYGHQFWLRRIESQEACLLAEEERLEWAKQQLPAVLSECVTSLVDTPSVRCQLERRSELEAKRVYTALVDTGGRPVRSIRPVPDIQDCDPTDGHPYVLSHWESECDQFGKELREWNKFRDHLQQRAQDSNTKVSVQDRPPQARLWKEYRAYQLMKVDNAKQWVDFWQRQMNLCFQKEDIYARQERESSLQRYHSKGERMRSHIEDARKQVGPVEKRLKWIEEQLSIIISATEVSRDRVVEQAMLPKKTPKSGQTTLRDLRPKPSSRSALRSNRRKQGSADAALDPIHRSKISKAVQIKPFRPQRSKIPTACDDCQTKDTSTGSPSFKFTPRRSSRLSSNGKKPCTIKSNLVSELGSTRETVLRKSDRISKLREQINTPPFKGAASSVLTSQTKSISRLPRSNPKARVAGNVSSAKPHGISKKHRRHG